MREPTKEQLVLLYFLLRGNEWAGADAIVRWTEGKEPGKKVTVLDDRTHIDSSLSRAGAVKVCKRLVPEYLESKTTVGYRSKKVILYRLQDNERAFIATARRFVGSPMVLLESSYSQNNIKSALIPRVEKALDIDLGDEREAVTWALTKSPTALFLALDDTLKDGAIGKLDDKEARKEAFMDVLSCAIRIDEASKTRSQLIVSGGRPSRFETSSRQLPVVGVNR
jgi:hypothetical protein